MLQDCQNFSHERACSFIIGHDDIFYQMLRLNACWHHIAELIVIHSKPVKIVGKGNEFSAIVGKGNDFSASQHWNRTSDSDFWISQHWG